MKVLRWCGLLASAAAQLVSIAGFAAEPSAAAVSPPGHVTGIGGVFVKSPDPKALSAWYRDVLGITLEAWGGALLRYDAPSHPAVATWSAFSETSKYFEPSHREFMLDFAVDDLDAMAARLQSKGVPILKRDDSDPHGSFLWIVDPDGTKIELWQAK